MHRDAAADEHIGPFLWQRSRAVGTVTELHSDVPDLAAFNPLQHSKSRKRAQATSNSPAGGGSDLEVRLQRQLILCSIQPAACKHANLIAYY
jgi:hypothetical protein